MGHTTKPCLSFPRLFYLSVYGSTEGLDTRGGGVGGETRVANLRWLQAL